MTRCDERGGGCIESGCDGDAKLHEGEYWNVSLCTDIVGNGGVDSSVFYFIIYLFFILS